tara:strand:- start:13289 stop:13972 length:684 start_codon:yes stop_codon:yes gene_type:complete
MNNKKNFDDYRNEIKYLLYKVDRKTLYIQYKLSKLLLSKSYPDRWINNIYFDNMNLDSFNHSIEGNSVRNKIRLRWYGNFSDLKVPMLEIKSKSGHKNIKRSFPIREKLIYNKNISEFFNNLVNSKSLPYKYKYLIRELRPVLANRYYRSYHISANKKYRITTDTSLNFTNLITSSLNQIHWKKEKDLSIVELKFKNSDDNVLNFMTEMRSKYRRSQISKYTHGLQL